MATKNRRNLAKAWDDHLTPKQPPAVGLDHIADASDKAKTMAHAFVDALSVGAMPEVDITDDGDVMLEWDDGSDPSITMVIDDAGCLFFALRSASGRMSGKLYCKHGDDPCPPILFSTVAGLVGSVVMERQQNKAWKEEWTGLRFLKMNVGQLDSPSSQTSWISVLGESDSISRGPESCSQSSWQTVGEKILSKPRAMSLTRGTNLSLDAS